MDRAALLVPEFLTGATVAGPPLEAHLRALCREAGLDAAVQPPDAPRGEGALVVLDARFPAISAASIWKLANALREEGGVLLAPDGTVIGVAVRGGDPARSLRDTLLASSAGPALVVDPEEAVLAEDAWTLAIAERAVRERHVADLARTGVRFVDPWRTIVETTVRIAPGCTIWPDVVLRGATVLDEGAVVQAGCWLSDTRVGSRAVVKPHSVCDGATIGPDCAVGPMAHLRPGSVLEADVKVGNFVEVKSTTLARGAKASHLTYLGDATVGPDANVGAGTITCNYDGFGKHRTAIGAGAFIGSNTALVAPVSVGDGAIVGAGSVITKDVPADALTFERAEQKILEGRAPVLNEKNRRRAAERKKG